MKKKIALAMVAAMALTGGAIYSNQGVQAENVNPPSVSNVAMENTVVLYNVSVEGQSIATAAYSSAEHIMVPLRETAEALGFEVIWNQEKQMAELKLAQTPIWTIVQPNLDQYAYNRMNKSLGIAPVNTEGKMFVPAQFFSEILRGQVTVQGNQVVISMDNEQQEVKYMTQYGVITAINNDAQYKSLQINGVNINGTILNIDEETIILNRDGERVTLENLSLGLNIQVKHSLAMTMSLPGQTYAYEINVLDTAEEVNLLGTAGTIEEISDSEENLSIVVSGVGMSEGSPEKIVLHISDETKIVDLEGNAIAQDQLTKEANVLAYYSPMLTKSLPPIGQAWKIVYLGNE